MRIFMSTSLLVVLLAAPASGQIIFTGGFETGTLTGWTFADCDLGVVANGGGAGELEFCVLESPLSFSANGGDPSPAISGRVFSTGLTEPPGANPAIFAQVGTGPATTSAIHPADRCLWRFADAAWDSQVGNDDRYSGSFTVRQPANDYPYSFRFSLDGLNWTYCDSDGAGSGGGLAFSPALQGVATSQ